MRWGAETWTKPVHFFSSFFSSFLASAGLASSFLASAGLAPSFLASAPAAGAAGAAAAPAAGAAGAGGALASLAAFFAASPDCFLVSSLTSSSFLAESSDYFLSMSFILTIIKDLSSAADFFSSSRSTFLCYSIFSAI